MAKAVTPEVVEAIVTRVVEKFTEALATITTNLTTVIRDTFNTQLTALNARLDAIEGKIAQASAKEERAGHKRDSLHSPDSLPPADLTTTVVRELLNFEKEKEDIRRRARNVIITGLPRQNTTSDLELVESFCEYNLTVKPHIVSARRIGNNNGDPNAKLCITLESPDMVDNIISSATVLRKSADSMASRVYFNRDLTKQQADAAYQLRCEKRNKRSLPPPTSADHTATHLHTSTTHASTNASAAVTSFQSG